MSFRSLLDRTVTIVPRSVTGTDSRGNDVVADGTPIVGVPAARDSLELSEDLEGRTQTTRRFVYFLPPEHEGAALELGALDRIVDGDETFELDGPVETVTRRRSAKVHHLEAVAYRIEG